MSSSNFTKYFDSLLMINRGVEKESFDEKVLDNLSKWGYIVMLDDDIVITQKGLNVLEFYLKNREFVINCTSEIQKSIVEAYSG